MVNERFVHLNVKTDLSLCVAPAKIGQYMSLAEERGHPAIGFTDYGTMRNVYEMMTEVTEHKRQIKPIYGIEFYVCGDHKRRGLSPEERDAITANLPHSRWNEAINDFEQQHGVRDLDTLTAWALNKEGIYNLFKLSSIGWVDGFYYKPRIDLNLLRVYNAGIAISTGSPDSVIHRRALQGRRREALEVADRLREVFGNRLWVEFQAHPILKQYQANEFALELLKRWKAKPLVTHSPHYLAKGDHVYQRMYNSFIEARKADDCGLPGESYYFATREDIANMFRTGHAIPASVVEEGCDNTVALAEMCEAKLEQDRFSCYLPDVYVPPELDGDSFAYLKRLCVEGWTWRKIPERAEEYARVHDMDESDALGLYAKRLAMELGALKRQGFVNYILLVYELYGWVRGQGIACGPGRGSAAGSLVNFLTGITSVDPIEHGLLFERFISPERIDLPDIDMDFEDRRRDEIIQHFKDKYGVDRVSQIATVGKLKGKACLRDISRSLGIPPHEIGAVTKAILERSSGDERASATIEDSFKEFDVCREFDKKHPEVLKYAKKLEGLSRGLGIHAAGILAAPKPLDEMIPLETRDHDGHRVVVSAVDMYGAAAFGLPKFDFLGLRTMTVLKMACEKIKEMTGEDIDLEELPLNEADVLEGFTRHDYVGIFQYDSPGADKICQGVKFEHFEDVAAMTALNRPGTARSGLATQYVARKKDPKLVAQSSFHPLVSAITSDTLGIIVYQEHVIKIFTEIAGFAPGTADSLRKKIAKKFGDEALGKERENFIKGAKERSGIDEATAGRIMDAITFFGSYGFNKSHATAYGMIAYWGMYLKVRYPIQFYWALLSCEPSTDKIQRVVKDSRKHGVAVLPPDVSTSRASFHIVGDAIRGSLNDIKGVGQAAADTIVEHQPYTSLFDFLERIDRRKANKGAVEALVKSGAMDSLIPNVRWFLEHLEDLWKVIGKGKHRWPDVEALMAKSAKAPGYSKEERVLVASSVSPLAFGKHPIEAYKGFMKKWVKVPITSMGTEDFYEVNDQKWKGGVFIAGVIVEIKLNQVGDFHTGKEPDDAEKRRMGWGKQYANVNIEDASGVQNRVKFDWDIFEAVRSIIQTKGRPVIAHCSVNSQYNSMRAHFVVDVEAYRKRALAGEELTMWEGILAGRHPALEWPWKSAKTKALALKNIDHTRAEARAMLEKAKAKAKRLKSRYPDKVIYRIVGMVTHTREKPDKKGKMMGFFGVLGVAGYQDVAAWGSVWPSISRHIVPGRLIDIELEATDWSAVYGGDRLRVLTKSSKRNKAA